MNMNLQKEFSQAGNETSATGLPRKNIDSCHQLKDEGCSRVGPDAALLKRVKRKKENPCLQASACFEQQVILLCHSPDVSHWRCLSTAQLSQYAELPAHAANSVFLTHTYTHARAHIYTHNRNPPLAKF